MNVPVVLLVVKETSPDGEAPVTVEVHVVNLPTFIEDGEQETETEVDAFVELGAVTVRVNTAEGEEAPAGEPAIVIVYVPGGTTLVVEIARVAVAPVEDGVMLVG